MNIKNNNRLAILLIIIIAAIGGGLPVFVKIGLKQIPPFTYTFLRFFIAFLCIFPSFLKEKPKLDRNTVSIVVFSLFAVANVTLFAFGIRLTSALIGQMLYASVPIIVAIFSFFFLKDKSSTRKIVGVFLGFAGTVLIIFLPVISKSSIFQGSLLGNLLIITAVVCYSIYTTLSKPMQKKYSPTYLTTMFFLTASVIGLGLGLSEIENIKNLITILTFNSILSVLYVSFLGSFVYYLLYQYAIKHSSPLIASMLFYVQPVATFVWASALLGEKLTVGIYRRRRTFFIGSLLRDEKLVTAIVVSKLCYSNVRRFFSSSKIILNLLKNSCLPKKLKETYGPSFLRGTLKAAAFIFFLRRPSP